MKVTNTLLIASAAYFFCMPAITPAKATSPDEAINKLISTVINKASGSQDFIDKFCRIADAKSGVFSIRSFEGAACQNQTVAAMAELICGPSNFDQYSSKPSKCHTKALAALGGKNPEEVLTSNIAGKVGKARDLMCSKMSALPEQLHSIASKACQ